jgi:hypothetical protein
MSSATTSEAKYHPQSELCLDVDADMNVGPDFAMLADVTGADILRIAPFGGTPAWLLLRRSTAAEVARVVLEMHTDMQLMFFEGFRLEVRLACRGILQ